MNKMNRTEIRGRTIEFDKENVRIVNSYKVNDEIEMCAILEIFRAMTNYEREKKRRKLDERMESTQ